MANGTRRLGNVRWEPCPAMIVADEVIHDIWRRTQASQLERSHVRDLTHMVAIGSEDLPDVVRSPAANLGFVCEGTYPDEPLDEDPVILQTKFDPDEGYELIVFLRGNGCPDKEARREIIESEQLRYLRPRRTVREFLEEERCAPLVTGLITEDEFREAVTEAVANFIIPE